jgi:hypothetical protein
LSGHVSRDILHRSLALCTAWQIYGRFTAELLWGSDWLHMIGFGFTIERLSTGESSPDKGGCFVTRPIDAANDLSDYNAILNDVCFRVSVRTKALANLAGRIAVSVQHDVVIRQEMPIFLGVVIPANRNHHYSPRLEFASELRERGQFLDTRNTGRLPEIHEQQLAAEDCRRYALAAIRLNGEAGGEISFLGFMIYLRPRRAREKKRDCRDGGAGHNTRNP